MYRMDMMDNLFFSVFVCGLFGTLMAMVLKDF